MSPPNVFEMERQARIIAAWAHNVYVKIPVTNTRSEPALDMICRLTHAGVKVNVTALTTLAQVRSVAAALKDGAPACISVFAADSGYRNWSLPIMSASVELLKVHPKIELTWPVRGNC